MEALRPMGMRAVGALTLRERCPCCLSSRVSLVYEEPYAGVGVSEYLIRHYEGRASPLPDGFVYRLSRCGDCGLTFQAFIPDQRMLDDIYDHWVEGSRSEAESQFDLNQYRYLSEQVEFMIQHVGKRPAEIKALDFGFGWGHWARMAMGYGCDVFGVELSRERQAFGRSIGMHVVDLDELPSGTFDFVHTEQVFEHLAHPRQVVDKLAAALQPNGLLKISVPDAARALSKLAGVGAFRALDAGEQMAIAPLEHINSFTRESLVAFARCAGLRPLRPSLRHIYNATSGMLEAKRVARVLARPIYRHILRRGTFMYFVKA